MGTKQCQFPGSYLHETFRTHCQLARGGMGPRTGRPAPESNMEGVRESSAVSRKRGSQGPPAPRPFPPASAQDPGLRDVAKAYLGKGAILAALRDKHRFLGLLGLLEGLSPLQATLALASV